MDELLEPILLRENNLYQNGEVIQFDNGEQLLLRPLVVIEGTLTDEYHIVKNNDRLDLLAYRYYKDEVADASKYWWVIADANIIENPLDLTGWVGKEILIPNITKALLRI